jgi:dCTP diphosphatase
MILFPLPSLYIKARTHCTLSTIMGESTTGRKDLGLEDLRNAIDAFIAERDWEQFHSPKNLAMALSVEVSEIVDHFQWLTEEQSQGLPPEKLAEIREEIGDVMIYLTELADKLGIDPVEAAKAKMAINEQKYPADLVKGKSFKYSEYE